MNNLSDIQITRTTQSRLAKTDFDNLVFGETFSDHMFAADYMDGEWKNFQILPYSEINISPSISALHYGQCFFEGLKAYRHIDGKVAVFRTDKNAERFNKSAERLCMPQLPVDIFINSITALVDIDWNWVPSAANHSLYIRPFVFATDPFLGVTPSATYRYMVLAGPTGPYFSKLLKVKIETQYTLAAEGGIGYAKAAGNYGGAMLPARKAAKEGFDQLIWTDAKTHHYIEEMGAANIMFMIDGKLITPSIEGNTILKGITRDSVLTLARGWGVPVEERRVSVNEIIAGIENSTLSDAFGTGTAFTITCIGSLAYNGTEYFLNNPDSGKFSDRVLNKLNQIRRGEAPDEYGWNHVLV